jgi:hypothetical protein
MDITNAVTLNKSTALFAAFIVLPLLAATTMANAQNPRGSRESAMQNCIATAQKQFPDSDKQNNARVSVYKACMTSAGHRP